MLKMVLVAICVIATMAAAQFSGGDGTESNPFIITTAEQLDAVRNNLNAHYKLGNNIVLNDTTNWQDWETNPPANSWTAISNFNGTFDGDGFVVGGVYINSSSRNQGFFGLIGTNGTIKNLGIVASFVRSYQTIGGLAGINQGLIINSYSIANVLLEGEGDNWNIGGLVGSNQGTINSSFSKGNVKGNLVGSSRPSSNVGGLVGANWNAKINNSLSTANVTGHAQVGGLVGMNTNSTITNSFSTGRVQSSGVFGGLVGMTSNGTTTNSFYDSQTSGQSTSAGGTARTTTQMKQQSTFVDWDFENIWGINSEINNGYPYLQVFYPIVTFNSNGGSAVSPIITKLGTTISRPSDPTRNGYTFAGWFRNADGTNEWNFANDRVTTNLTLHARWTPITYNITYNLNNGTNHSANPATYTIESSTFTLQSPTRHGYDFRGWWTSETSGERVTEISTGSTGDRTLWTRWTPTNYTITYLNANENHPLNPATYTIESETITLNAPTATSASTFLGWFDNANLTGTPITEIPAGSTGNKMLYASWRTDYRIMFPAYDTTYDGNEKRFETLELWAWNNLLNNYFFTVILTENIDFEATYANNTNAGMASVTIVGKDNFSFIEEETRHFSITKREIEVIWGNTEFQWNNEYQVPTPSVRSEDEKFTLKLTGERKNRNKNEEQIFEIYTARVELEDEKHIGNIDLKDSTVEFTIGHRIVNVEWGALRTFEYGRRIQHPEWSVDCDLINKDFLYVTNRVAVAGNHRSHIQIIQDNDYPEWHNFRLAGTGVDYEITRRPLTARLRNTGDSIPTSSGLTKEELDSILTIEIDFDNFAVDSTGADDKSALTGRVRFNIQNDNSQNSLRSQETLVSGEHIVAISGESQNYTILERKIVVIIGERFLILENYPRATSIVEAKKSDNRHGIKFAVNPVSEKAEISVVLPNNERAVETSVVIYDMTGNVVWTDKIAPVGWEQSDHNERRLSRWDLRNSAGRFVANGIYLVIAEVKDRNGRTHTYSARLGVRR